MSKSLSRPPVEPTHRRALTPARKLRCHTFHGGRCEACGEEVDLDGPRVIYDHRITLDAGGADDDGPNLRPVHVACDKPKTAQDQGDIAKARRLRVKHGDNPPPPKMRNTGRKIPARPFPSGSGRAIPSRPFRR